MAKHACSVLIFKNLEGSPHEIRILLVLEPNESGGPKDGWRWSLPGGKCCENIAQADCCAEAPEATAARECKEETGFDVAPSQMIETFLKRNWSSGPRHRKYVFLGKITGGEPFRKKAFRHETPQWFTLDSLPRNLFPSHKRYIQKFLFNFFVAAS